MPVNSTLINIFGGPGVGKSTLAASLYSGLSASGKSTELVTEFVKDWAWRGQKPSCTGDQVFLCANQIYREAPLYGQVELIVTDSPWLLSPVYEQRLFNTTITACMAVKYYTHLVHERGVKIKNFVLQRFTPYQNNGRFQDEEQAKHIDNGIIAFLDSYAIPYEVINVPGKLAEERILQSLWTPSTQLNTASRIDL